MAQYNVIATVEKSGEREKLVDSFLVGTADQAEAIFRMDLKDEGYDVLECDVKEIGEEEEDS